jgi:hypothetical protein
MSFVSNAEQENDEVELLNPDEEKNEISIQLQLIRKKHDRIRQENSRKRMELEVLKKELSQATFEGAAQEESSAATEESVKQFE